MKKRHALHNEAACDFLLSGNQFNDWVVTTAFYAALHFVHHEMFPLTEGNQTYIDFTTYYSHILKRKNKQLTKHAATIQLVGLTLPSCAAYYRWLHDACMNARYRNYNVSSEKAGIARHHLQLLRIRLRK